MFLPRLGARPWPHSGPGAQYPNVINEEIEPQRDWGSRPGSEDIKELVLKPEPV